MSTSVKTVLSAFNSEAGKAVKYETGTAMVTLAESRSAYGRALRDITVVALSGRWLDQNGVTVSDNAIEARFGVPVRHPRARLTALTDSGLKFLTDIDVKANADVWNHVSRMFNAGKAGRDTMKETAAKVAAVVDVADKRAMWLETAIPARVVQNRKATPPTVPPVTETTDTPDSVIVPENVPVIDVKNLSVADLLSLFHEIGDALTARLGSMELGDRKAFRENVAILATAAKASATK